MRLHEGVRRVTGALGAERWPGLGALLPAVFFAAVLAWTVRNASAQEQGPAGEGSKAPPKIVVEKMKFDFGEVWASTKIEHAWAIRNEGGSILRIISVKPSCGCTVLKNYDREILPGEAGKLPIVMDTSHLRSKVRKIVQVRSNDPENAEITLDIAGTVKQRIGVEPARGGSFGRIKPNEVVKRTLTLKNNTDNPVELSLMTPRAGSFEMELTETKPGQSWELKLRTAPPYREQYNRAQVRLKTNLAEQPVVEFPASVYVLPKVEISPSTVIIPRAMPQPRKQPVRVTFNTDESYKVLSATADDDQIDVKVHEARPNAYTITLGMPANYLPPESGGKLTVKTNHPGDETLTVLIAQRRTEQRRPDPGERLVGKPVPPATFDTPDGEILNTGEADSVSVYMFYASWCGYCKRALPQLSDMYEEFKDKGVRFVGVNQDSLVEYGADPDNQRSRTKEQVVQQWKDMGIGFTQAFDPAKMGSAQFLVSGLPTILLVGKTGQVERVYTGGAAVADGSLKKELADLVAGKALPPQKFVQEPPRQKKRPAQELEGKPAPQATFVTATEENYNAVEPEQVSFTMFYASWCGHCKKALPKIEELTKKYKGKPVRFAAVSLDQIVEFGADPNSQRSKTKEFVVDQFKDYGLTFTQAFDPGKAGQSKYKVTSFPTMFLVDQNGQVAKVYIGRQAVEDGTLHRDIEALLAKPDKDQADASKTHSTTVAGSASK